MEGSEPYPLLVELACGKLNQVRTQAADWQQLGLQTPPEFDRELDEITRVFGRAVLNQPSDDSDAAAGRVLERSYSLADRLLRLYTDQMFVLRGRDEGRLATRLAARLSRAP